ncbi:MBL fold metallo-hydrolase [Methylobacterium sp. C25]|uniref:MBL fold metallo-hydrolase n=1 Tax=Methylobacterium sp. C25 TaxID=2721622 RepID=UPI001F2E9E79|nr:MBL fold metallo-hydrolase [Methylobacterium sp. C25]MCE4224707.1 MBL fold metallo-hydrolase [Methylobacterium sp. C25]
MIVPAAFIAQDAPADQREEVIERSGAPSPNVLPAANVPVLRRGTELILFDLGDGGRFQPTEGKLLGALRDERIDPREVTQVVLTHAHPDHLWGLRNVAGELNFPNADYVIGQTEWDFWTAPDVASRLPEAFRGVVPQTQSDLAAIAHRVRLLKDGDEVAAGISAVATPGHTPGHLSFAVAGGDGLFITADALTHELISVEHPAWQNGFDYQSDVAIATRQRLLDRLTHDRMAVLAFHFPFPGLGRIERAGSGYRYTAAR